MLSLLSVWTGLAAAIMAVFMQFRRSLFHPIFLTITVYTAIFSLTMAGVALWALRKHTAGEQGVRGQRVQCYVGIGLALFAVAIVYEIFFQTVE
jgi:hypothetical protein